MTKEEKKKQDELWKQEKAKERREEFEKIKGLGFRAKLGYFWDYYKIIPIIIGIVLFIIYMIFSVIRGLNTDMLLYVCTLNCDELDPDTDQLKEDYIKARGGIKKSEAITIDSSVYVDPDSTGTTQRDVAGSVKITSYVGSGAMDVFLAPANATDFEQKNGFYMALDDLLTQEEIQKLGREGYLYYATEPETDEDGMLLIHKEADLAFTGETQTGEMTQAGEHSETLPETKSASGSETLPEETEESGFGGKDSFSVSSDTEADTESGMPKTYGDSPRLETEFVLNTEAQDNMHIYGVRVDQSGVLDQYQIYYDRPVWFSIISNSSRTEEAVRFLHFLLGEEITAETEQNRRESAQ